MIAVHANVTVADRVTAGRLIAASAQLGADAKIVASQFHHFTSGPGSTPLSQLDSAARTLSCQRVDQYFGAASREIGCRYRGLAAAIAGHPATDSEAQSQCLAAYQACMNPNHCNSVAAYPASCTVTLDVRDLCTEKYVPMRDAALGNVVACSDLTIYRAYTYQPLQPLVRPDECRTVSSCLGQ